MRILETILCVGAAVWLLPSTIGAGDVGGTLLVLVLLYLLAPIKHPSSYTSYKEWWADRSNWLNHE